MELLTYNQAYEAQVVELWNQELFADPITVHKFRQQALLDDNFDSDLCYVAQEDGKTVGFLLATKRKFPYLERGTEPERGWINAMFVAEMCIRDSWEHVEETQKCNLCLKAYTD